MKKLTSKEVYQLVRDNIGTISSSVFDAPVIKLYGVPRGGVPAAYIVKDVLQQADYVVEITEDIHQATLIVDDIIDSGATHQRIAEIVPHTPFYAIVDKPKAGTKDWYIFPWEGNEEGSADDIPLRLLQYIGEDINREGLRETPVRFLKAWKYYTSGYGKDPKTLLKVFKDGAEEYTDMILVKDIPVYSHCEHHLAPFYGVAHVAYIPDGKIVGLSKLARLVDMYMRRLQVQERLTIQIANALEEALSPLGVAVLVYCSHSCMIARGVQVQGSTTVTSAMRGVFLTEDKPRAEVLGLVK